MKLMHIILLSMLSLASLRCAEDTRIAEAIKRSDPDALRHYMIPGFFVGNKEKKRYLALAQGITNQTYSDLTSFGLSDSIRFLIGAFKLAGGSLAAYAGYKFYKGHWDGIPYKERTESKTGGDFDDLIPANLRIEGRRERGAVYGILGFLSVYFLGKGLGEFGALIGRQQRLEQHRNALAVEAIIQRLPEGVSGT